MKHKFAKQAASAEITFEVKLSPARLREDRAAVAFLKQVRARFVALGLITSPRTERVAHDLGEIHGVFQLLSSRLKRIVSQRSLSVDRTREALIEIQRELTLHLPYHLRQLKRPLEGLIDDLDNINQSAKRAGRRSPRSRPRR